MKLAFVNKAYSFYKYLGMNDTGDRTYGELNVGYGRFTAKSVQVVNSDGTIVVGKGKLITTSRVDEMDKVTFSDDKHIYTVIDVQIFNNSVGNELYRIAVCQ